MKIRFTVDGIPKGKERPRVVGSRAYTPNQTVSYEQLVAWQYRINSKGFTFPLGVPLDLRIIAYYQIPRSESKKRKELMRARLLRPTLKPDYDNIAKIIADSLNGIAYRDDAQIVDGYVRKFYSDKPRVVVTIQEAKTGCENDDEEE